MEEKKASMPSKSCSPKIEKELPRDETDQEICGGASSAPMLSALAFPSLKPPENVSNFNQLYFSSFFDNREKNKKIKFKQNRFRSCVLIPSNPIASLICPNSSLQWVSSRTSSFKVIQNRRQRKNEWISKSQKNSSKEKTLITSSTAWRNLILTWRLRSRKDI